MEKYVYKEKTIPGVGNEKIEVSAHTKHEILTWIANEQAKSNELKKIELLLYARNSGSPPTEIEEFTKKIKEI